MAIGHIVRFGLSNGIDRHLLTTFGYLPLHVAEGIDIIVGMGSTAVTSRLGDTAVVSRLGNSSVNVKLRQ